MLSVIIVKDGNSIRILENTRGELKADSMLSLIYSSHLRTPRPDHPGIGEEQVNLA